MILINNVNVTDLFVDADFTIDTNKRNFNTFRGVFKAEADIDIRAGMEIVIDYDGIVEFGGQIQSLERTHNTSYTSFIIYATGYEQILDRRTTGVTYTDTASGTVVNDMVTLYLAADGITVGNIDAGLTITLTKNAISIRDILDECALTSGYVWFISPTRQLYFQADYNYTTSTFPTSYEVTATREELAGYANKIFAIGGNDLVSIAEDTSEISKMASRYGLGVYGLIIRDGKADTQAKVDAISAKELSRRAFDKRYIVIKTRGHRLTPGEVYTGVTIPYTDVNSESYAIDDVVIEGNLSELMYTATLEPYQVTKQSRNTSWQSKFKQFVNQANTEVDLGGGGGSADIEKLTDLKFYSNGFVATYETEALSYTWTKDIDGKITSLIDTLTGATVLVTWNGGAM